MSQPAEAWDNQLGRVSKEIEKGIPEASLSSLGKAVTMARGAIPKDVWNPKVLGELGLKEPDSAKVVQNGSRTPIPLSAGSQRSGKAELPRPKRNIKKRTYGDASFEGYGEGFVDDETGYSTGGDGDDRAGRKRPKKVCSLLLHSIAWLTNKRLSRTWRKLPSHVRIVMALAALEFESRNSRF